MSEAHVSFSKPLTWLPNAGEQSVAEAPQGSKSGIYLWTAPSPGGHLVYYVGETARTLATRLEEHLYEQLSGRYRFYDPTAFLRGEKHLLWRGVYGRGGEADVSGFVDQLPAFAPPLAQYVRSMRFMVAPTDCSDRLRRRIEAELARWFQEHDGVTGGFQERDIHYEPRGETEAAVEVTLDWAERPVGAPDHLRV